MSKFKAMKFRVKDADHSAHIQTYLFSLGYIWRGGRANVINTDRPFLITDSIGYIVWGEDFANYPEQEHALDVHTEVTYTCSPVEKPRATIELNGVRYYVDDLEKALRHIKPVENA